MYQERASWNWFVTPVHEQVVVTCRNWAAYNGEINFVLVVDQNVDQYVNVRVWRRFLFYFNGKGILLNNFIGSCWEFL